MGDRSVKVFSGLGLLVVLSSTFSGMAAAVSVTIKAERIVYTDDLRQIDAAGGVEIVYQDVRIITEKALLDQDGQTILATGNVNVFRGDDALQGEAFTYDMRSRQGRLTLVQMALTAPALNGTIFLEAEEALFRDEFILFQNPRFTSCSLDKPHYHLTGERMEYYPGERLVLRKVWYWEGQFKLLYFPYLVISLKDDGSPFEVRMGQDGALGWFVYVGYNYYLNDRNHGTIYTEITEWGGDGLGIRNITETSVTSEWYQDFFYRDNSDNEKIYDQYKLALGYENWSNPQLTWSTDFENWYQSDWNGSSYSELRFNLKGLSPYPSLSWKYRNDIAESELIHFLGNWNYYTSRQLDIYAGGEWYYQDYLNVMEERLINNYNYTLRATQNWSWGNLTARFTNHLGSDTYSYNYLPEITFNMLQWDLPGLGRMEYQGQYTNYQNVQTWDNQIVKDQRGQRFANDFIKKVTLWQKKDLQLTTNSKFQHRYYLVNQESSDFSGFSQGLDLTKKMMEELSVTLGIEYTGTDGEPEPLFPYNDHYITRGGALTNGWNWNGKALNANINTGYNFTFNEAKPLQMALSWTPDAKSTISFSTVAYWQDTVYYYKGFGVTQLNVRYAPKVDWRLNLGLRYDFQNDYWGERYGEAYIVQALTGNWRGELTARYSDVVGDFSLLQLGLIYNWDCREVYFNYDYVEARYWLQLHFKIFPRMNIGWGSEGPEFVYDG